MYFWKIVINFMAGKIEEEEEEKEQEKIDATTPFCLASRRENYFPS